MKTLLKRTVLLCLLIVATVCLGLFTACGGDDTSDKDTVTYTVLVQDDSDAPVKDVRVSFNKGSAFYPAVTGADGKATAELAPDTYSVTLGNLPAGYSAPENVTVTKDNPSATVKLTKDFAYVVKLVNEDGSPFYRAGVQLAICEVNGSCHMGSLLGEGGIWTTKDVPGDYKVQIIFSDELEGQFAFDGSAEGHYYTGETFTATKTEMTIVIRDANTATAYTVAVVNPDNTPAKGVYVNLATATSSFTPAQTDANGKAKIAVPSYGVYSVTVNAPEGYTYDSGIKTTAAVHVITVQLLSLNNLPLSTPMTPDEISAFGINANTFDTHFLFNYNFNADETKYFAFTAYNSGDYAIYCKSAGATFKVCFDNTNFSSADNYPVNAAVPTAMQGTKNNKVYFSVKASAAGQLQFVVAGPDRGSASSEVTLRNVGAQEITVVSETKYATVMIIPSQTGKYELKSEGNFDTKIECYANNGIKYDEDDNSGEGNNFKYVWEIEHISTNTAYFRIFVKSGATFPATFNIRLTRIGDIEENVNPDEETVNAEHVSDTAYGATGLFKNVDLSIAQTAVLGDDGYYHLGTADGPVIVAKIAQPFRDFGVFTTENPNGDGKTATPYYVHFKVYDENNKLTGNYNYEPFLKAYSAKCNYDGVYPVNAEIKLMLERWAAFNINEYTFGIDALGKIEKGNEWLIPCGYYTSSSLTGTGAQDDAYSLDLGSFNIALPSNQDVFFATQSGLTGKFTVTLYTDATLEIVSTTLVPLTATAIDGGYAFDCEADMLSNIGFKVKNTSDTEVNAVLRFEERSGTILEIGDNEITVSATDYFEGVAYTFIAEVSGSYTISSSSEDAAVIATDSNDDTINHIYSGDEDGSTIKEGAFEITFNAEAGVEYTIIFSSASSSGATFTVTVEESDAQ